MVGVSRPGDEGLGSTVRGIRGPRWEARGGEHGRGGGSVCQGSPPRTDSPRGVAAGAGGGPLRRGRGGGARGLGAAGGVPAAPPPGRAGFLARRTGGPCTLLGQMLPKARRRPPCSMLPLRHRHRPRSRPRRAPSAPRPARRRPAGRGAGGRGHAGGCPPARLPSAGARKPPAACPGRAGGSRARGALPRARGVGAGRGVCPGGKTEEKRGRPPSPPAPRFLPPPTPPGPCWAACGRRLAGWAVFFLRIFIKLLN